jgi:alanyl-tRNA synthetase
MLADMFKNVFPELKAQEKQVAKIIQGEEKTFLNTLENGLRRFASIKANDKQIDGNSAFELYDTYGFPIDLTRLLAEEKGWTIDEAGFEKALEAQKARGRAAAKKEVGDWTILDDGEEVSFVGYDDLKVNDAKVLKYRTVKAKKGNQFQVVLNKTPFYGESGGQRGDTGLLFFGEEKVPVIDTIKENDLIVHIVKKFPADLTGKVVAEVNTKKRQATSSNHTAVHLMHAALHDVLGSHALQKGQDVDDQRLRFDFSHFSKMSDEEVATIEAIVNQKIRLNIPLEENRAMPIEEAKAAGATALFGEKYGDKVRMITFDKDFSRELCGGTHVAATGEIGLFKILSETGVAAGVRRIEAVTSTKAEAFINKELATLASIRGLFKNTAHTAKNVEALQEENKKLRKEIEKLLADQAAGLKDQLRAKVEQINGYNFIAAKLPLGDAGAIKTLAYQLESELGNAIIVFGAAVKGKPQLTVTISKSLVESHQLHAGNMVRELAKEIKGGGGGQAFFATAGGKDVNGLDNAVTKAKSLISA